MKVSSLIIFTCNVRKKSIIKVCIKENIWIGWMVNKLFRYNSSIYGWTTTTNKGWVFHLRRLYETQKKSDNQKTRKAYQTE